MMLRLGRPSTTAAVLARAVAARSFFAHVPAGPPDKILGLTEAFKADSNPQKISLGAGAYRDAQGKPYVLGCVRRAEERLFESHLDHEYGAITGNARFAALARDFLLGEEHPMVLEDRVASAQALSGTGACRVLIEFMSLFLGRGRSVHVPTPTWPTHGAIITNANMNVESYRYYSRSSNALDFGGMRDDIHSAPDGSVFLLHACAHNPTGQDPSPAQWDELSSIFVNKGHLAFFDCAYAGFASGDVNQDAYSIRKFLEDGNNVVIAQSFAKNFGLYGERAGAVHMFCGSSEEKERVLSQLKRTIRPMYSNPPLYGARLVELVLSDPLLRKQWAQECQGMADRIKSMRQLYVEELAKVGSQLDWSHLTRQIGMFGYSGLSKDQVARLRHEFSIYCTDDGRMSIAGINEGNVRYLAEATHVVTQP